MLPPRVLVEDVGPNANVVAVVEEDGRCVYFYLHGAEETGFGVRSCWVRNLRPAPEAIELEAMREGRAPMLPRSACAHPDGAELPVADELEVAWLPSGDGAALLEGGDVLAVIPPDARVAGWARDCTEETPLAAPLGAPGDNPIFERLADAVRFWDAWSETSWGEVQARLLGAYERALGPHRTYYKIDGDRWPPRFLARFEPEGAVVLATGGMSVRPQPKVTEVHEDPRSVRRVELAFGLEPSLLGADPKLLLSWMSGQSALPWDRYTWLGRGHTITCRVIPQPADGPRFTHVLLADDPPGAPELSLPPFMGDPVRLLWLLPITAREHALAEAEGAETLLDRLRRAGAGAIHRPRPEVTP